MGVGTFHRNRRWPTVSVLKVFPLFAVTAFLFITAIVIIVSTFIVTTVVIISIAFNITTTNIAVRLLLLIEFLGNGHINV